MAPKTQIRLSKDLSLPLDLVLQKCAVFARTGAGKTYLATKIAEEMRDAGAQVVVLDPAGAWYGLRLAGDGKSKGVDIYVFGGEHGDIPLEPDAGALVADLIVDKGISVVLDVSDFRRGEMQRFATAFAERFFHRKKRSRSPVHLFIEEAQLFAPQKIIKGDRDTPRMLGAFEDIVKLGRYRGIGTTLISQRPASVNKDCTYQTEVLYTLQISGTNDRKAIEDWIEHQNLSSDEYFKNAIRELAGLEMGYAFVWSPSWLRVFKKIHIDPKWTFDSSKTPEFGEKYATPKLIPIDLDEVSQAMKDMMARVGDDDPEVLKQRIVDLERNLANRKPIVSITPTIVEVPTLTEAQVSRIEKTISQAAQATADLSNRISELKTILTKAVERSVEGRKAVEEGLKRAVDRKRLDTPIAIPEVPKKADKETNGNGIPKGAREMLRALSSVHPKSLSKAQLGTLARIASRGGTFAKYLSILKTSGLVDVAGEDISITKHGLAHSGPAVGQETTEDLVKMWSEKIPGGARRMLRILVDRYPKSIYRTELGSQAEISDEGGTFAKYLSILRSNGLCETKVDTVKASETLFPD